MSSLGIGLLCAYIGLLNVGLNFAIRFAATREGTFQEKVLSLPFLVAFLVGTASLMSLFYLYHSGVALGRGILLAGAISIIGGTMLSLVILPDSRLTGVEVAILLTLSALYILRIKY